MVYKIKSNKYKAKKSEIDGKKFPSILEGNCYKRLKMMQEQGSIKFFLRQIPFDLPGNVTHRVDYMVFLKEDILFIEAKGRDLPIGKMKRKQVEELYNITINLVHAPYDIDKIIVENTL